MKKIILILVIFFFGANLNLYSQDLLLGQAAPTVNTATDKAYALSLLWSEIKYNFVGIDNVKFDVDKFYKETLERVLATTNDIEFYRELRRFVGAFNDGHTQVFVNNGAVPFRLDDYTNLWPVTFKAYGKHLYVNHARDDYKELLGAELISINGIPIEKYMQKYVLPLCSGSNEESKWSDAAHYKIIGRGYVGRFIDEIKFKKVNGEIYKTEDLMYNSLAGLRDDSKFIRLNEVIKIDEPAYPVDLRWKENDIAVVNIDAFWAKDKKALENKIIEVMAKVAERAQGLILDLRNNTGGDTDIAWLTQMLIHPADSLLSFGSVTRINNGYGRAQGNYRKEYKDYYDFCAYKTWEPEWIPCYKDLKPIHCPVVILIGPDTQSACEDLLINLYELPDRPKLVGLQTAGTTGAPLVIELPHKVDARICTLRPLFPYSKKPFTEPIQPDVKVPFDMKAYMNGQDVTLEKGIEVLKQEIKKSKKVK